MRGILLQKWIISCFATNKNYIKSFYIGLFNKNDASPFAFQVDEVVYFNKLDIPPNLIKRNRFYIPSDQYSTWDCIFDNGTQTAFFYFSNAFFSPSHDKDVEKSFTLPIGK